MEEELLNFIETNCKGKCGMYFLEINGITCLHYNKRVDAEIMTKCKEFTKELGVLFT